MKTIFSALFLFISSPLAEAFPSALRNPQVLEALTRPVYSDVKTRDQPLGDLVNGLLNGSIPGVTLPPVVFPNLFTVLIDLPPVVAAGRKKIPDDDHPFQEPGPGDQRGGCPGLNILANYGYIDRSGVTSATELLYALQEVFGWAPDLTSVLVGLSLFSAMDISSLKMSIGHRDSRTDGLLSQALGFNTSGLFDKVNHDTYEVDGSVLYTDSAFVPDGTTDHFNSTKWAGTLEIAKKYNGFGPEWLNDERYDQYLQCVHTNPVCSWTLKQVVFYIAQAFPQTTMTSADENGVQLPPDIESISTFWGVKDNGDGTFSHVTERLPPGPDGNWYRRSMPLTFAELAEIGLTSYIAHPVLFGTNSGKPNSFTGSPDQLPSVLTGPSPFCAVFTFITDNVPGSLKKYQSSVQQLVNMLLAPAKQHIGC